MFNDLNLTNEFSGTLRPVFIEVALNTDDGGCPAVQPATRVGVKDMVRKRHQRRRQIVNGGHPVL